jgi:hypothetical protein
MAELMGQCGRNMEYIPMKKNPMLSGFGRSPEGRMARAIHFAQGQAWMLSIQ